MCCDNSLGNVRPGCIEHVDSVSSELFGVASRPKIPPKSAVFKPEMPQPEFLESFSMLLSGENFFDHIDQRPVRQCHGPAIGAVGTAVRPAWIEWQALKWYFLPRSTAVSGLDKHPFGMCRIKGIRHGIFPLRLKTDHETTVGTPHERQTISGARPTGPIIDRDIQLEWCPLS